MNGWRILFWSCVGFHIVGMFVYMLFATDKVQNWAKLDIKQHAKGKFNCYLSWAERGPLVSKSFGPQTLLFNDV